MWLSGHLLMTYITVVEIPDPRLHLKTSYYSVGEGDGSVDVCAQVTTNQFDNEIRCDYFTTFGSAAGKKLLSIIKHCCRNNFHHYCLCTHVLLS